MRGLALKIFLSFWLVFALLIASFAVLPDQRPSIRAVDHAGQNARIALRLVELRGVAACRHFLSAVQSETRLQVVVLDAAGSLVCGPDESASNTTRRSDEGTSPDAVETAVTGPSGATFTARGIALPGFRGIPGRPPFPTRGVVTAIIVSGLVCFALARQLARPLRQVRDASQRLAGGDLQARAGPRVGARRDEIGDLVRDFDTMAGRLEALVHSQTQLLSDISHELRSPLARLNVALELARRKAGAAAGLELARIELEAERMNELVGRLIALARAENAGAPPDLRPLRLDVLVRRVAADAGFEAQRQQKTVDIVYADAAVITGDARLISSAIDNVVRNAVRHTPAGSRVEISVRHRDHETTVEVKDAGAGVPPEELERIFTPFHRVQRGRERDSGGAGLGLAIARRAVMVHGGTISAAGATPAGLVVTLRFPQRAADAPQSTDSALSEPDRT